MPELPDVEVYKRYLDATSLHQEIEAVELTAPELLHHVSERTLRSRLTGHELASTRRHGKHLFAEISGGAGWLRLHFGMTGEPRYYREPDHAPSHTRLRLDFTNGHHLAYDNQRKLGEIGLVDDPDAFVAERGLGCDPLASDCDVETFRQLLSGRRGMIKTTLMNQEILAGLGNVYADEILFQVGLHPKTRAGALSGDDLTDLHHGLHEVIDHAIEAKADPSELPEDWLLPHRGEGGECPRCGGTLETIEVSGRTTWLCPRHQGRPE